MTGKWSIKGFDTLEEEFYPFIGNPEFDTEKEARIAASEKLKSLEHTQPSDSSGGQIEEGIQDRVFIVRPDQTHYRFLPTEEER